MASRRRSRPCAIASPAGSARTPRSCRPSESRCFGSTCRCGGAPGGCRPCPSQSRTASRCRSRRSIARSIPARPAARAWPPRSTERRWRMRTAPSSPSRWPCPRPRPRTAAPPGQSGARGDAPSCAPRTAPASRPARAASPRSGRWPAGRPCSASPGTSRTRWVPPTSRTPRPRRMPRICASTSGRACSRRVGATGPRRRGLRRASCWPGCLRIWGWRWRTGRRSRASRRPRRHGPAPD